MFVCTRCAAHFGEDGYCAHDGSKLVPASADVLVGQMIGPYRIEAPIGVGGMGKVYRAVHPEIGSRVAIKVLADAVADSDQYVERFFAEARAVNLIRHENIVNVLDLGRLPHGPPYIVMEYLDGRPLSRMLTEDGPMPQWLVVRMALEVLDALADAHAKSIVHRDLKPDNIFMSPNGHAKVLDFGIAKLAPDGEGALGVTREGALLGTPHYMSPEQARAGAVDGRSDIYSVGVILFESVTGKRPFTASSLFDLLRMHLEEQPPPPNSLRPDLDPRFEAAILRAMAKDPAERFQSAREFSAALAEVAAAMGNSQWATAPGADRVAFAHSESARELPLEATSEGRSRTPLVIAAVVVPLIGAVVAFALASGGTSASADAGPRAGAAANAQVVAPPRQSGRAADSDTASTARQRPTGDVRNVDRDPIAVARDEEPPPTSEGETGSAESAEQAQGPLASHSRKTPNPSAFDISAFLPTATGMARKLYSDAVLVRIDADGVRPNGKAELTLDDDFGVLYRFVSPSRSRRPDDLPIGVPFAPNCLIYVSADASQTSARVLEGWQCDSYPLISPRCSVREVWDRAIAKGAPDKNAVGSIGIWRSGSEARWSMSVGDVFSEWIEDDC